MRNFWSAFEVLGKREKRTGHFLCVIVYSSLKDILAGDRFVEIEA
jgi:hypothetical protein